MEKLVAKTRQLGWSQKAIRLETEPKAEEKSKLLLLGKILSTKVFSKLVVKDIIDKAWNTTKPVDVSLIDKNVFMFSFNHEVDVFRVWDRWPWSLKGEHLILKKYNPDWSLNEVDFSITDFWVQIHSLPLNRQFKSSVQRIGRMIGEVLDVDLTGNNVSSCKRFIRVRVGFDVSRPLPTRFPLDREDQGLHPLWIPFKFEKLGNFCYGFGILGHDIKDCHENEIQKLWKEKVTLEIHSNWLRSEANEFQPGIDLEELKNSDLAECGSSGEFGSSSAKDKGKRQLVDSHSPWISAVQLTSYVRNEQRLRKPLEQTESIVENSPVANGVQMRPEGMVVAVIGDLEGTRVDSSKALRTSIEDINVQLGEEDLVQRELKSPVGPSLVPHVQSLIEGADQSFNLEFRLTMVKVGPLINLNFEVQPNLELTPTCKKKSLDEPKIAFQRFKKVCETPDMSSEPPLTKPLKKNSKSGTRAHTIKSLARAQMEDKKMLQLQVRDAMISSSPLKLSSISSSSQSQIVQMAEEAGLTPPPPHSQ